MSGIAGEAIKELEFIYESDAASSFLVITCSGRVIDYQIRMLENNDAKHTIPMELVKKEGVNCFYYNITSKIPLSIYLRRNKLSRNAFLKLLLNVTACINNSAGYLLYPSNFILNSEFIYIDPRTLDVMIVYIPAEIRHDGTGSLETLTSELLMQHINEEGFSSGNLVQRLLSEIKSETFSIRGLMALLNELLYGLDTDGIPNLSPKQDTCNKTLEENREKDKIEERQGDTENVSQKKSMYAVAITALLQLVMGGVIYMCRGILGNTGNNTAANYAVVALIVLAIEVLIFRKLHAMKLFSLKDTGNKASNTECASAAVQSGDRTQNQNPLQWVIGLKQKDSATCKSASKHQVMINSEVYGGSEVSAKVPCIDTEVSSRASAINGRAYEMGKASAINGRAYEMGRAGKTSGADEKGLETGDNSSHHMGFSQKTEILGSHTDGEFVLRSTDNQLGEKDIVIDSDEFIIGRLAGHVDHILHNNAVGKLHAEFLRKNGCCFVKDLNSMNGTFINNRRIESNKEIKLRNNDNLRLANCEYVFLRRHDNKVHRSDNNEEAGYV